VRPQRGRGPSCSELGWDGGVGVQFRSLPLLATDAFELTANQGRFRELAVDGAELGSVPVSSVPPTRKLFRDTG
jgi:hypothetical protein